MLVWGIWSWCLDCCSRVALLSSAAICSCVGSNLAWGAEEVAWVTGFSNQEPAEKLKGDVQMWKEEKEEQRQQTPLKLLTLLHDLSPPRCESHMFGGWGREHHTPPSRVWEPPLNICLNSPSTGRRGCETSLTTAAFITPSRLNIRFPFHMFTLQKYWRKKIKNEKLMSPSFKWTWKNRNLGCFTS